MAPKTQPIHIAVEQSIQAANPAELLKSGNIIWAKLRGYPWWPGRVKSFNEAPVELAQIAKTHYRDGSVVAVYFFGSHDFSLVPTEALRPFEPNWDLFSGRSTAIKFKRALMEAKDSERYRNFEKITSGEASLHLAPNLDEAVPPRRRGRPPKHPRKNPADVTSGTPIKKRMLRMKKRPKHLDPSGVATREHVLYCRRKLQKILLRREFKDGELPIAEKILNSLADDKVTLDSIRSTKIGRVLRMALDRGELSTGERFENVGRRAAAILKSWRKVADQEIARMGL